MKKDSNVIQKILLLIIGILGVILASVLIHRGYQMYQEKVQMKEWEVRHQEVQAELEDVQMQIKELAGDGRALQEFLDEKLSQEAEAEPSQDAEENLSREAEEEPSRGAEAELSQDTEGGPDQDRKEEQQAGSRKAENIEEDTESREVMSEAVVSERTDQEGILQEVGDAIIIDAPEMPVLQMPQETAVSDNRIEQRDMDETISGNGTAQEPEEETISGNAVTEEPEGETISGNAITEEPEEETISGNAVTEEPEEETISGNAIVDGRVIPFRYAEPEITLEERRNIRSSYEETLIVNEEDKNVIRNNTYDFSGIKIACLGDSLTEGSNLDSMENYQMYSYPSVLKSLLQAEEVYNLGVGGSSYGRYWENAFVDRYKSIPADTDIIIVMGGTNDGFAASSKELGSPEEKKPRTFYGDVDELMKGLRNDYPDAKIIFTTPLPNILHDYLRKQRDYLLPQNTFADAVKVLAAQYDIDVIDLYNSNLLDTHDTQIISAYMPDGVHGNPEGYRILAEHLASKIIQIMENEELYGDSAGGDTVSGNEIPGSGETVSGNETLQSDETVSGNDNPVTEETVSNNAIITEDPQKVSEEVLSEEERPYEYGGEAIVVQ